MAAETPLHIAARNGHVHTMNQLLKEHPEWVRTPNEKGQLPIHLAVRHRRQIITWMLLDQAPDTVTAIDNRGNTVLHSAVKYGGPKTVTFLVQSCRCRSHLPNRRGDTIFHLAARRGHLPMLRAMLRLRWARDIENDRFGDGWSIPNQDGELPQWIAARKRDYRSARLIQNCDY